MSKIPQIREYQGLPVVTAEKMKYLDKIASMEYAMPELALMENAGAAISRETVAFAKETLLKESAGLKVAVCCGRGNNGGDGLVAARCLKASGAAPEVFILAPSEKGYGDLTVKNLERARAEGVEITLVEKQNIEALAEKFSCSDLLLDALLGAGSVGKPTGPVRRVIQLMNKSLKPIIAVDIPSGLSPDTGHHSGVFITARVTFTLGFAKTGLMANHAKPNTGEIKVLDIGYPKELVVKAGR